MSLPARDLPAFYTILLRRHTEWQDVQLCKDLENAGNDTKQSVTTANLGDFQQVHNSQAFMGLGRRGHGRIRGGLETVFWTRILQNGPYGHLHAIMRACMRSGAGTGDCAPTLARRAHVWSPAPFVHKI